MSYREVGLLTFFTLFDRVVSGVVLGVKINAHFKDMISDMIILTYRNRF